MQSNKMKPFFQILVFTISLFLVAQVMEDCLSRKVYVKQDTYRYLLYNIDDIDCDQEDTFSLGYVVRRSNLFQEERMFDRWIACIRKDIAISLLVIGRGHVVGNEFSYVVRPLQRDRNASSYSHVICVEKTGDDFVFVSSIAHLLPPEVNLWVRCDLSHWRQGFISQNR